MNPHETCQHPAYNEIINGHGRTIALQCTVCLHSVSVGVCPGKCGKTGIVKLPTRVNTRERAVLFCGDDCARAWQLERAREARAVKRAAAGRPERQPGLPGVSLAATADVLSRARR